MRTMYDSIDVAGIPADATMVAGYVDGHWPTMAALAERFPHAVRVGIAVFASTNDGHVLDVETGDAAPADAPGWVRRRRAAGVDPTVYCNASTWPAVHTAFAAAGDAEPHYWIALYDGAPSIPTGAIAKQYRNTPSYDISVVADYWPGIDPPPEDLMACYPFTVTQEGGVHFARGSARNVSFFCDNTLTGAAAADLRVVIWASGRPPEIHDVTVSNAAGTETTLTFSDPGMTHSVTVTRTDGRTDPVYAEAS